MTLSQNPVYMMCLDLPYIITKHFFCDDFEGAEAIAWLAGLQHCCPDCCLVRSGGSGGRQCQEFLEKKALCMVV